MTAADNQAPAVEVTPESLDAMEARENAATEGPWEVLPSTDDEMVEDGDECFLCGQGATLVSSDEYPAEFGRQAYAVHHHAAEPHHVMAGEQWITGNYEDEAGGILRGADVVFVAHARMEHPALIAAVRERDESLEEYANLCDRQAAILTRAANAFNGQPGPLMMHSHHDVGELAEALVAEVRELRAQLQSAKDDAWKGGYDACKAGEQRHSPYRPVKEPASDDRGAR